MKLIKKVIYTLCSGDLDKECENFVQKKQLPQFKRNCPLCGSKTKEVLGPNHFGITAIVVIFLCIAGLVYWQVNRMQNKGVDFLVRAAGQVTTASSTGGGIARDGQTAEAVSSVSLKALQERFEAKDYAGVLKAGETALDISPQDTTLLNNVGVAALRLGDFAKARRYLERVAEIKPTDPYLRYNLGSLEALAGNKDSAVNHLKQACRLGLAPANFPQDADFASLAHDPRFEDLVKNKNCQ